MLRGERINGIIGRRSWLLALAALAALLAVAALTLAPARGAPPDDLALSLSLIGDSDNVVPAGSELQVAATLSYTADTEADLRVTGGKLRVSGSHEWESNGRSSLGVQPEDFGREPFAGTGWAVAVQERLPADGGAIVVAGARGDTVNAQDLAGSADLFVGGEFVKQLTAGGDVQAGARFGQGVDAAGGYIVIGAPGEGGDGTDANEPQGAVYIFDAEGNQLAKLTPGLDAGSAEDPRNRPITRFGDDVAIDDAGETIVVAARSSKAQRITATVFVFTKPASGWADRNTDDNVPWLSSSNPGARYRFAAPSGIDISGDGSTIVWAFENPTKSILAVHEKPSGGWANAHQGFAMLDTADDIEQLRPGETVAISDDGGVIAASGVTRYAADQYGPGPTPEGQVHQYAGGAYVWERDGSEWDTGRTTHDVKLNNTRAVNGDMFGHTVAISGDGSKIAVSNAWQQNNDYARGEVHVFLQSVSWIERDDEDYADIILTSPQASEQLFFGFGLAIDGNTLIVGQSESIGFLSQAAGGSPIETGHGRAYSFDLTDSTNSVSAVQESGAELAPSLKVSCADSLMDGSTTWTCPLSTEGGPAMITIPTGTPDGAFTISGSVIVDGGEEGTDDDQSYSASLEVTIGTVDEVTEVAFDFATDDDKSTISADDESTTLQLSVLNENGTASAAGKIASVLFTTTSGTLSLTTPASGCSGTGSSGLACQVPVDDLDATNSDAIQVELTHPGQSGTATVNVRVLSIAGASFAPDPLEIVFSGGAETLAISEPTTSLLNVNTPDMDTGTGADRMTQDNRDVMTLSVTAEDENGNSAKVPPANRSVTLKDPDGKTVVSGNTVSDDDAATTENTIGFKVETVEDVVQDVLDAAGNPQVEIDINATDALATGAYTLEVKAGGKTATQTINVSAGAAAVALSLDGAAEIGQRVTVTAAITDADGSAVGDGTPVMFTEGSAQATPALVRVSAATKTTGGSASAVYLVVASGTAFVTVGSGDSASDVLLIQTAQPTPEPVPPAESLGSTAANSFTTYLGAEAATASELLAGLEGVSGVLLWDGSAWQRYIVADGREVPGSVDFEVTEGAILWLSG